MKNCLIIVILLSCWNVVLTDYVIERYDFKNNRNYQPDTFIIPEPPCSGGDVSALCSAMNGSKKEKKTQCECVCNEDDGHGVFYKSTFGFYDNKWKCANNTQVRNNAGCSILFNHEDYDFPITAIVLDYVYSLQNLSTSCRITNGSFARCSGKWEALDLQWLSRFSLNQISEQRGMYLIYSLADNAVPDLSGRIVRLNIDCTSQPQSSDNCVLFKIEGQLNCPVSFPSSSLIQSTTSTPMLLTHLPTSTSSTSKLTSTSILKQQQTKTSSPSVPTISGTSAVPVPMQTPKAVPISTPRTVPISTSRTVPISTSRTVPISTPKAVSISTSRTVPISTSRTVPISTSRTVPISIPSILSTDQTPTTSKINGGTRSAKKDDSGMIAGVLAGVIGFVIIVIALIVVVKRRKKRDAASTSTTVAENVGYGRGVDNSLRFSRRQQPHEDEYSYAYNNAVPFVNKNKQDLEKQANTDYEAGSSVVDHLYDQTDGLKQMACEAPVYNTSEEPVYAKVDKSKKARHSNSADAPIYNTLEEPEYAKLHTSPMAKLSTGNQDEPLYNVLEGPETDEGLHNEPPSYQVPEGPFPEGAPVYDVLEGPESDECPVYEALEGQDPHVYGALVMAENQGPPEVNREYDDMVYDSVGDLINDQGDIYQELNQSGQRDSDVYQALNYPGNTMHLNEINQTHSNA